jgi:hypothetical protein
MNCALRGGEEKDMLDSVGAAVGWVAAAVVVGYIIYVAMYGHHATTRFVRVATTGAWAGMCGPHEVLF